MRGLSGVYTIIHVRRTPVRRACTPYMYDSVNTALGATYDDHLRLIGMRIVDFLLVLTELFSLDVTAAARISVKSRRFRSNGGRLTQNFK